MVPGLYPFGVLAVKAIRSRGADASESCEPPSYEAVCLSRIKGRRSAERRIPSMAASPQTSLRSLRKPSADAAAGLSEPARLPALHARLLSQRTNAATQSRPRFARAGGHGRYPRRQSRLSKAPCTPVVMPEGTMPGPPGSGVTSPARRNRTRSIDGCRQRRPFDERDRARLWSLRRQSQRV
jgi:hypothetical protein